MAEDKDPFSEFGGKTVSSEPDPFSAFGGKAIKQPAPSVNIPKFNNGLGAISPSPTEPTPVVPQYRNEIQQRQIQDAQRTSNQIRKLYSELPEQGRRNLEAVISSQPLQSGIREPSAEEVAHERFMETTPGKILGTAQYLGSKATKGATQLAKGLAWVADKAVNPVGPGNQESIDKAFQAVDDNTNFGLTRTDLQNIEGNALVRNLGSLAEVAPAGLIPGGAPAQMAAFGLQGIGSGKDQIDEAEKRVGPINPFVKDAFILGNGVAMAALMKIPLFKSIPTGLKGDVAAAVTANTIKEAAGKELTGTEFRSLLDKGVEQFGQKLQQGGLNYLRSYNKAVVDLGALKTADFALKEGVNASEGKPVFEQNLGDLASGLKELATVEAPIFAAAGVIPDATKLFKGGSYKNSVVDMLMTDPSEANIARTKDEITQIAAQEGWNNNEINATIDHIDKIGSVAKRLPKNIRPDKLEDAVDIVLGRDELKQQQAQATEARGAMDESVKEIPTPEETLLQDKIDQANDKLRDLTQGTRTTYSKGVGEEEGKFFKTTNGIKEEINPSRYDLEVVEREAKQRQADRDKAITEFQSKFPDYEVDVMEDLPKSVSRTFDRVEQDLPTDPVAVSEASDWLYGKYKELSRMKESDTRKLTIEQIDDIQKQLGEDISLLETHKLKYHPDLVEENTIVNETPEQATGNTQAENPVQEQPNIPVPETSDSPAIVEDTNAESANTEVVPTVDPVRQKAIDAIVHGIVGDGERKPGDTGPRFDLGLKTEEQKRAIRDITNGKYDTAAARNMLNKVMEFEAKGEYPIIEGLGGASVRSRAATAQEIQESIDSAKQYQLAKEQDIERNNQGLKDLGFTYEDFLAYENYRKAGEPGSIPDNGRATGNATENVQRAKNDKGPSKPKDTGSKTVQGSEPRAGDPIRSFASKLREGKISKIGGFRASTGFEAVWDAGLETVATALDGGAKIADAIEAGLKHIKQTEWYKNLSEKDRFDKEFREHLQSEYAVEEMALSAKNENNEAIAKELGLTAERTTGKRTNEVIEREATDAIKKGYDTPDLVDRILNDGHTATDTEVAILAKYRDAKLSEIKAQGETLATDGATMPKSKFNELMAANDAALMEMQDVIQAIQKTGSVTGSALRARQIDLQKEYSLGNMVARMRKEKGGEKLTREELADITKRANELEETKNALEKRLKTVEEQNARLKAERVVKKTVSERLTRKKESKELLAKERVKLREELSAQLKKMRSQGLNSAGKATAEFLATVAPYVAKMTRNLAQEGIVEIKDLVQRIKEELDIKDLEDRDVMDMIAGKYDEAKPTRSELQANIRSLKAQAKLVAEIEDIESGKRTASTAFKSTKAKNEYVEKLRERLKELTKGEEPTAEEKSLAATKKRLQKNIEALSERIAKGDYDKEEKPKPAPLDAEALQLRRKYDEIKRQFDLEVARKALQQRSKSQKFIDDALNITALPRALKSSFDFSAVGRQGLFLLPHLKESKTALKEMFGQAFSEEKYNNWISDLKHTELYDLMKESGLYIADKSDPKLEAREEMFTSKLAERIPGVKQSERAYTAYLNVLRTGVFEAEARKLMERGYTPESDPKEFKSLARVVNILSGRGEIPEAWGHSAPKVLSLGLFSPRFLAARLQTLYLWADPSLSRNAKLLAAKDIGSVLGSAVSLLTLATMAGYKVDWNPTSTNYLKIQDEQEEGTTYYDIMGGLPQYVRLLAQLGSGKRTSAAGNVTDLTAERGKDNPWGVTRLDVLGSFARGKLAPAPGIVFNLLGGKDVVGNPYGLSDVPFEFVPLPFSDVREAYKVGGIDNSLKVLLPTQFGIGASSYQPK